MVKRGDVVTLKGNPDVKMNVQDIFGNMAECFWLDKNHSINTKQSPVTSLQVINENGPQANEGLLLG